MQKLSLSHSSFCSFVLHTGHVLNPRTFTHNQNLSEVLQILEAVQRSSHGKCVVEAFCGFSSGREGNFLKGKRVALTTPEPYASRLIASLKAEGADTLWIPSVSTKITEDCIRDLMRLIGGKGEGLEGFTGIAFTSRNGITAMALALERIGKALTFSPPEFQPFFLSALGRDGEALQELIPWFSGISISVLLPEIATPLDLVKALGDGKGRKVLCPVPCVEGVEEPFVVPQFLQKLEEKGWQAIRTNAYRTEWCGPMCALPLIAEPVIKREVDAGCYHFDTVPNDVTVTKRGTTVDAIIFTSTAEVEGILKSLRHMGVDPCDFLGQKQGGCVTAAHGPVTAKGAEWLGLSVDVVGENFQSFEGVVECLGKYFICCSKGIN